MVSELVSIGTLYATAGFWATACLIAARAESRGRAQGEARLHRMLWIPLGSAFLLALALDGKPHWALTFLGAILLLLLEYRSHDRHVHELTRFLNSTPSRPARLEVFSGRGERLFDDQSPGAVRRLISEMFDEAISVRASDIDIWRDPTEFFLSYHVDGSQSGRNHYRKFSRTLGKRTTTTLMKAADAFPVRPDGSRRGTLRVRRDDDEVDVRFTKSQSRRLRLRLHDRRICTARLDDRQTGLGMSHELRDSLRTFLGHPGGLLVVCGPEGQGKTTTAYAILSEIDDYTKTIQTIEDPVEIDIRGSVEQSAVDPARRESWSELLDAAFSARADVILVGNADAEAAPIVMKAITAGCQVITTVDADDVVDAIRRLRAIDVDVAQTPRMAFLTQRLVRRSCAVCRRRLAEMAEVPWAGSRMVEFMRWQGCGGCSGGYRGRIAVFEFLMIQSGTVERLLTTRPECRAITEELRMQGRRSLWDYGGDLVESGIVDRAELQRALAPIRPTEAS